MRQFPDTTEKLGVWYLIHENNVRAVQNALRTMIDRIDERCAETGCMCDLREQRCSSFYSDVLHNFDTGLNDSDGHVPNDFRKEMRQFPDTTETSQGRKDEIPSVHAGTMLERGV